MSNRVIFIRPSSLQQDPQMAQMMQTMQDPEYKSKVEDALKSMKEDPELKPMLEELETAGPVAMMKWVHSALVKIRIAW